MLPAMLRKPRLQYFLYMGKSRLATNSELAGTGLCSGVYCIE